MGSHSFAVWSPEYEKVLGERKNEGLPCLLTRLQVAGRHLRALRNAPTLNGQRSFVLDVFYHM